MNPHCTLSAMPVCPRCNKRPARRSCPALRTAICSVCCARERAIELACPESCSYLRDALIQASQRDAELRMKDQALDRAIAGTAQRALPLVFVVQGAILDAFRGAKGEPMRGLKDSEILEAVDNAIKNLETEDSGLIYEHHAPPRVDALSRAIREALDAVSERAAAESRVRRSERLKILSLVRIWIAAHMRYGEDDNSYLRHISLFIPWPEDTTRPLII